MMLLQFLCLMNCVDLEHDSENTLEISPVLPLFLSREHFCIWYKSYLHPTKQIKKKFAPLQHSWVSWEYQRRATEIKSTLAVFEASVNAGSNLCNEKLSCSCPVGVLEGESSICTCYSPISWKLELSFTENVSAEFKLPFLNLKQSIRYIKILKKGLHLFQLFYC